MDATTVTRVKALLDITSSTHDTVLGTMVSAVSKRIETYIDRPLEQSARTEEYDLRPRQNVIYLRAYPVASIASVKISFDWDFSSATALSTSDYHVDSEAGLLHLNYFPVLNYLSNNNATAPCVAQVVYTAGFSTSVSNLISAYPDIAYAADTQTVATWRRRDSPQGANISLQGSSVGFEGPLEFVPDVAQALTPYRRLRFAANS
tara:strand:+ start:366 stop:980 length:615 start_codon:yes stop_codon:yes gene_type:complete